MRVSGALSERRLAGPAQSEQTASVMRLLGIVLGGPSMLLLVLLFLLFVAGGAYGGVCAAQLCFCSASAALRHSVASLSVMHARAVPSSTTPGRTSLFCWYGELCCGTAAPPGNRNSGSSGDACKRLRQRSLASSHAPVSSLRRSHPDVQLWHSYVSRVRRACRSRVLHRPRRPRSATHAGRRRPNDAGQRRIIRVPKDFARPIQVLKGGPSGFAWLSRPNVCQ